METRGKKLNKSLKRLLKSGIFVQLNGEFERHPRDEKAATRLYFERCT